MKPKHKTGVLSQQDIRPRNRINKKRSKELQRWRRHNVIMLLSQYNGTQSIDLDGLYKVVGMKFLMKIAKNF